jgi:hypothetical protein
MKKHFTALLFIVGLTGFAQYFPSLKPTSFPAIKADTSLVLTYLAPDDTDTLILMIRSNGKVDTIPMSLITPDLSGYYTRVETQGLIGDSLNPYIKIVAAQTLISDSLSQYIKTLEAQTLIEDSLVPYIKIIAAQNLIKDSLNPYIKTLETETLIGDSLANYYNISEVQSLVADSLVNYYTKTEVQALLADSLDNYYNKTETQILISDSIAGMRPRFNSARQNSFNKELLLTSFDFEPHSNYFYNLLGISGGLDKYLYIGHNFNYYDTAGNRFGKTIELEYRPNDDGLYLLYQSRWGNTMQYPMPEPNLEGTFTNVGGLTAYTTNVNDSIIYEIVGYKATIETYTDNRGGIWQVNIDNVPIDTFSTYGAGVYSDYVLDGIGYGAHRLKIVFLGDDPDNAPSGGTSRGWINLFNGTDWRQYGVKVFTTSKGVLFYDDSPKILASPNSIWDWAVQAAAVEEDSIVGNWIPEHSNVGATANEKMRITLDTTSILVDNANYFRPTQDWEILEFRQYYTAYNSPKQPTKPLWNGIQTYKFNKDDSQIEFAHTLNMDYPYDIYVASAFYSQYGVDNNTFDLLIFGDTTIDAGLPASNQDNTAGDVWSSAAFVDTNDNIFCSTNFSLDESMRPYDNPLGYNLQYTFRTDGVSKVYNNAFATEGLYPYNSSLFFRTRTTFGITQTRIIPF